MCSISDTPMNMTFQSCILLDHCSSLLPLVGVRGEEVDSVASCTYQMHGYQVITVNTAKWHLQIQLQPQRQSTLCMSTTLWNE
jgi:hypothetical protein